MDKILDTAGQKGTGKWTVISSQDLGIPITLIAEAVYSRCVSALKDERVAAAQEAQGPAPDGSPATASKAFIEDIRQALYASKIVSYARVHADARRGQGIQMEPQLRRHRADVARRLHHPQRASSARSRKPSTRIPKLTNLLLDRLFHEGDQEMPERSGATSSPRPPRKAFRCRRSARRWRSTIGYRSERLPANLLQAQRDYFGAHTYERVDKPRGEFFHTNWTGRGGDVSSGSYNV